MILCVCWKLSAAEQVKTDCCHTPAVVSTLLTPLPVSCPLTTPHHFTCITNFLLIFFLFIRPTVCLLLSAHNWKKSQNFLKFEWKVQLYTYTAFPNGLACCPGLFKPVMAQLHRWGFISTIFIDDTLLMGNSELECVQNVKASLCLFEKLGFVIHPEKSVLAPTHVITYLGFEINSVDMTVTLRREKN